MYLRIRDQELIRGNLALSLSVKTRQPVRVIRGANLNNAYAPAYGYRYDGKTFSFASSTQIGHQTRVVR